MINYREATADDMTTVARLHAQSWQQHYRGILRDDYLDHKVMADRQEVWQERFSHPSDTQHIVVATEDEQLVGFACTYLHDDPQWGALLDNLHVRPPWQGRGVGRGLMKASAEWVREQDPEEGLYLWVLEKNTAARAFYERMAGVNQEKATTDNPGGGTASVYRIVWPDPSLLIQ